MDPINGANPILDALRREVVQNLERLRKAGKLAGSAAASNAAAPEPLETALRRKLAATDRQSKKGLEAATRAFVETALLDAFGSHLVADPQFAVIVRDIAEQMRDDPELRTNLDEILRVL